MLAIDNPYMSKESIINVLLSYDADYSYLENKYGQTAKDIDKVVSQTEKTEWDKYMKRLDKRVRGSFYVPDDTDNRSIKNFVPNSNKAPSEEQSVSQAHIQQRIANSIASERRKRVAAMNPVVQPIAPPLPSPSTARPPPLVVGGRKKTTRNNKGHTNVSRRRRRTSRILRNSRVAARKAGRCSTRRTRRRYTAFFA
jgi:hypothetical protein